MKSRLFMLVTVVVMLLCLAACSENENKQNFETSGDSTIKNTTVVNTSSHTDDTTEATPIYFMDLFDGDRKIWFHIISHKSNSELRYDSIVYTVYITENKKVTEMYYTFGPSYGNLCDTSPNPFSHSRLTLADFANLSDDEIIEKLEATYAKASQSYQMDFSRVTIDITPVSDNVFQPAVLPYEINYRGRLDASGNEYEEESITMMETIYHFNFQNNFFKQPVFYNTEYSFSASGTIKPTVILDKEYVGIKSGMKDALITENRYAVFEWLKLDSPSGGEVW